jgi:Mg-chelatase subunit ChlD
MSTDDLGADDREALLRWRLALGPSAERVGAAFSLEALRSLAASLDIDPSRVVELDEALSFIYDELGAGEGYVRPHVPKWLTSLREFFRHDVVALVQKDAVEKTGMTELLLLPETLPFLEKNVALVATVVLAKGLVPDGAREAARSIVREVAAKVKDKLETQLRTAVIGALRRNTQSPVRVARNLDVRRTIRQNLRGWDRARRRLVPQKLYFWQNQRRRQEWDVVILVDQSGSMVESVVYASIMAAIFASIDALKTRLVLFDTEVVDVTPIMSDPVEVLFTAQLGGATDIHRAVAYAQEFLIERPERTLLLVVSDLREGGDAPALVARMRKLVDSRVKVLCLLALSDEGTPAFDRALAGELGALGIPCFGCTPRLLPTVIERVLKGQPSGPVVE